MLLRSHGGGNCSGDGGAHEGGPDLHPTGLIFNLLEKLSAYYSQASRRMHIGKLFLDFSSKLYVVGTQMNRLNEMVLLSTQKHMLKLWVMKY